MRTILTLLAFFVCSTPAFCGNNHYYISDNWTWGSYASDNITDVTMSVSPRGIYADVDLTFTLHADNLVWAWDMQAILLFELPANSFIHNSWLWLNDSVVVEADIVDRNIAQSIYYGYVIRSMDPSLLRKTGPNQYSLNVYPILPTFPRKVRISYSTLMTVRGDKAGVTLPTDLFCGSQVKPVINTIVNKNAGFTLPDIPEAPYQGMVLLSTQDADYLAITPDKYSLYSELNLQYTITQPTQYHYFSEPGNRGVYEVMIPAENNNEPPKNLTFVLDVNDPAYSLSMGEIKKRLKTFLLSDMRPTDSFNVFYANGSTVSQLFPGWTAADPATVLAAVNSIPDTVITPHAVCADLYSSAFTFCQTKPADLAQAIVICNNLSSTSSGITFYNDVVQLMGGALLNKVNLINCTVHSLPGHAALAQNSGGYYAPLPTATPNDFIFVFTHGYDIHNSMRSVLYAMYERSDYFDLDIPVSSNTVFQKQRHTPDKKYYPGLPYMESGFYYGQLLSGSTSLDYLGQNSVISRPLYLPAPDSANNIVKKGWVNSYITQLEALNTGNYTSTITDTSLNNRVLCYSTAFLALEFGDTVDVIGGGNQGWPLSVSGTKKPYAVRSYPNPFTTSLNIESATDIEELAVYDIGGRLIYSGKNINKKIFVWPGKDKSGKELAPGTYIIDVKTKGRSVTLKVQKL